MAFADTTTAAAPTPSGTSTSEAAPTPFIKNVRAFYEGYLSGPSAKSLSGNKDGSGTNLSILHTFGVGYRVGNGWSLGFTQGFSQTIDEKPSSEGDPWVANDPYVSVSNSSLWKNEKYGMNLYGYVRYYMPFSRATNRGADAAAVRDSGLGSVRFYLNPTKTWLDGKLTFNGVMLFQARLPKRSNADRLAANGSETREDFFFLFDPILAYTLNPKLEVYIEYATGYLRHTTDGKLSKLNNPSDGQYAATGLYILVGKKLLLNPFASVGPVFRGVKNADFGLIANYTFL